MGTCGKISCALFGISGCMLTVATYLEHGIIGLLVTGSLFIAVVGLAFAIKNS